MSPPKKEEKFSITRFKNRSNKFSYRVTGYKNDGTRVRRNYKDKGDAIESKNKLELENSGVGRSSKLQRTTLSNEQLSDAETAVAKAGGNTLTHQIVHYHNLKERVAKISNDGIGGAIAFYEKHYRPEITEISLYAATERFLKSRADLAEESQDYYRKCTKLLVDDSPKKMVHQITPAAVEKILAKYFTKGSYRTYRRGINVFFNWAVRARHCLENPCEHMERAPRQKRNVSILSLEEVQRLLKATTELQEGAAAASVAILLFAGLRPSELNDLKPADIREAYIVVSGGKLRGRSKRRVPIPPVLSTWLEQYPFDGRPAGWQYKMKRIKEATDAKKWVSDILRHTSISYQLERDHDEAEAAFQNGTSTHMINLHYRDLVEDPEASTTFWDLTPKEVDPIEIGIDLTGHRKRGWPSDQKLEALVGSTPLTVLAKELDVSDTAIRKRCQSRGISLPSKRKKL